MNHCTVPRFWKMYANLPQAIKDLADKNFALLKRDTTHPSLHFKRIAPDWWSARVGDHYRAVAFQKPDGFYWFWIGTHEAYNQLLRQ